MKHVLIIGTMFMATMLFTNVYAIKEEQQELLMKGMLAVTEAEPLLDRTKAIMTACGAIMQFGVATEPCINFMINFKSAIESIVNTYDTEMKSDPLNQPDSFLDIIGNTTKDVINKYD